MKINVLAAYLSRAYGNRTRDSSVKGRRLNPLTNAPLFLMGRKNRSRYLYSQTFFVKWNRNYRVSRFQLIPKQIFWMNMALALQTQASIIVITLKNIFTICALTCNFAAFYNELN